MKTLKNLVIGTALILNSCAPSKTKFITNASPGEKYLIAIASHHIQTDQWNMFVEGVGNPRDVKVDSTYIINTPRFFLHENGYTRINKDAKVSILDKFGSDFSLRVSLYYVKVKVIENNTK